MRGLAAFIMNGRWQASLVAAAAAMLSLLLPPVLIVSGAAVALVTLRRGEQEGLLLMLLAGLGVTALAWPVFANGVLLAGGMLLVFWLPLYALAVALRRTISLALTLQLATALGVLGVLGFYLILADPGAWWLTALNEIKPLLAEAGLMTNETALDEALKFLAPFMPGLMVANLLAYLILALLLGRWWQSVLFNPRGFKEEFHGLRLGRGMALAALVVFALALLVGQPLFGNVALVFTLTYTFQGLAVAHGTVARAGFSKGWLVGLYFLMVLALPHVLALLCLLGVIDAWLDVRARIKPRSGVS